MLQLNENFNKINVYIFLLIKHFIPTTLILTAGNNSDNNQE